MTSDETYVKVRRGLLAHLGTMSDGSLKCYLYLLLAADHRTGEVVATASSIGAALGKSRETAYRLVRELVEGGYIRCEGRGELAITILRYETVDRARNRTVRRRAERAIERTEAMIAESSCGYTAPEKEWFENAYRRLTKPVDNSDDC